MSNDFQRRGIFVAGSDTGVGKTVVAAGLTRLARRRGLRALAVKPIETGCPVRSGELHPEDGAFLARAIDDGLTLDECAPFRFSLPASPYRAAAMEGRRLKVGDPVEHVLTVAEDADLTVVEGAGGLFVPIEDRVMMIDLIERLGYPVILVARSALGTINHTLLSLEALAKREIDTLGVILSRTSARRGPEEEFTPRDLSRLIGEIPLAVLPHLEPEKRDDPDAIADAMDAQWREQTLKRWLGT
jgi:dethiobiotin synthetase